MLSTMFLSRKRETEKRMVSHVIAKTAITHWMIASHGKPFEKMGEFKNV